MNPASPLKANRSALFWMTLAGGLFLAVVSGIMIYSRHVYGQRIDDLLQRGFSLADQLRREPVLLRAVTDPDRYGAAMNIEEILELDRAWRRGAPNAAVHIAQLMENDASLFLKQFRKKHTELAEIFLTDSRGLNAAMTNRTSDGYQADELWWVETFQNKNIWVDAISYDSSASTWSIPISAPLLDESGNIIGILKAVLDVESIRKKKWHR